MEEKIKIPTVELNIDEYFDLRQKAEMNCLVMERIGIFESHIMEIEKRLFALENPNQEA